MYECGCGWVGGGWLCDLEQSVVSWRARRGFVHKSEYLVIYFEDVRSTTLWVLGATAAAVCCRLYTNRGGMISSVGYTSLQNTVSSFLSKSCLLRLPFAGCTTRQTIRPAGVMNFRSMLGTERKRTHALAACCAAVYRQPVSCALPLATTAVSYCCNVLRSCTRQQNPNQQHARQPGFPGICLAYLCYGLAPSNSHCRLGSVSFDPCRGDERLMENSVSTRHSNLARGVQHADSSWCRGCATSSSGSRDSVGGDQHSQQHARESTCGLHAPLHRARQRHTAVLVVRLCCVCQLWLGPLHNNERTSSSGPTAPHLRQRGGPCRVGSMPTEVGV